MNENEEKDRSEIGTYSSQRSLEQAAERLLGEIKREEIVDIPIDKIMPNRFQPRHFFDRSRLEKLAESIKEGGVNQPIIVRKVMEENIPFTFELIAGERRLRASELAGLATIPGVIRDTTDKQSRKIALIENLQREDLTFFETMMAIKGLKDEYGSIEMVEKEIRLGRRSVEHYLKCSVEISSIPEIFEMVETRQERFKKKDLTLIASIMPELRKYQKSNKLLLERFTKKAIKKGIVKAAEDLFKKISQPGKSVGNNTGDDTGGRGNESPWLSELDDKIIFKITVRKDHSVDEAGISKMRAVFKEFVEKIESIKTETISAG